ncbi:MAG: GAF domain-containing protein [Anaerolineales bacterium]|nr:GAF domain-containing protein [Anaerolineales bacterium]
MNQFWVIGLAEPWRAEVEAALRELAPAADIGHGLPAAAALESCQLAVAAWDTWPALPALKTWPPVVLLAGAGQAESAYTLAAEQGVEVVLAPDHPDADFRLRLRHACRVGWRWAKLTGAAESRLSFLQVHQTLIQAAAAGRDLAVIIQLAADLIQRRLGYELVAVYLLEPEADDLALSAVAGPAVSRIPVAAYYLKVGVGAAGQCVRSGQVIQVTGPALADNLGQPLIAAELALPMHASGRTFGALLVGTRGPALLAVERELELSTLAQQLATIVVSLESAQREAEQARREQLLTHLSHIANSWLNPGEMLYQAVDAVGRGLRADRSTVSLFDWTEGVFITDHEHTNPMLTERRSLRRRTALDGALAQVAQALRAGQVLISSEDCVNPALQDYWTWLVDRHGVRSLVWVPIPDQSTGRLYSFSLMQVTHARKWTAADVDLLSGIADQLALALRNAELFDGMRQAAVQLEAKNAELEAFVYTVSHDLQAPVVSMRGFAGLLQSRYQDALDERGQSFVRRITTNADYLSRLLEDLLELSRVGRQEEPDESVSVQAVLDEVLLDLAGALAERQVVLDLPVQWPVVRYSRLRLRQVFSNLLTNAVKFMGPQADPHIQIGWRPASGDRAAAGLRPAPAGGEHIEFYVKDNGIGIHPDYQQRIFVPFERLKQVDVAGTGVGLSIVKRIVEGRGGRIWLESAPGAGTAFFFTLPLAAAAGDEAEEGAG